MTETFQVELGASEPWSKEAELYELLKEQKLLQDAADCYALETFLRMSHLDFTVRHRKNADQMSPSGKAPFIRVGPFVISEIDAVVGFCGTKGHSLSDAMDPKELADMRAYMALVENTLGNAELFINWLHAETYEQFTKPRYSHVYAWPLNHVLTYRRWRRIKQQLQSVGWAEKSLNEVLEEAREAFEALSEKLGKNQYFCGDRPTELDALVYGHMHAILNSNLASAGLTRIASKYKNLVSFVNRVNSEYCQPSSQETSAIFL